MPTLLSKLANYKARPGWYTKVIKDLAAELFTMLNNTVTAGGAVTFDSATASTLLITTSALDCKINGQFMGNLAAIGVGDDLFDVAGTPIGQAIYQDGTDADGISLLTDETAYVSIIATDSDGSGGLAGEGGVPILVAVVAGTATTYMDATGFLGRDGIQAALDAATATHDGGAGFVQLAEALWDENGGAPTATVTVTRD